MGTGHILDKESFTKEDIVHLLQCKGEEEEMLFSSSARMRDNKVGKDVYLRGLIEISNICTKDCLYCGIRKSNPHTERYALTDEEILGAAEYAWRNRYGSIVLQGGERKDRMFVNRIERLLKEIKDMSRQELGITLSVGEQEEETYRRWFVAGAHRYLLRIESSDEGLYRKIHPQDNLHDYRSRLNCIRSLQKCGYQTGSGVMIGLPFQTAENLADDLLFLKATDVDMVGMGPYLEHRDTPLWDYRHLLVPQKDRLYLGLHMVSILRLMMPDINIAATTALQAIDPYGREKAIAVGANVIMPNITPQTNRGNYRLYENKPGMDEGTAESGQKIAAGIKAAGYGIGLDAWGDSLHFRRRTER